MKVNLKSIIWNIQKFKLKKWGITFSPHQNCQYSSALYMTGDKAKNNFSFISPYLDFDLKFKNLSSLERNVKLRAIPINVHSLKRMWDFQESVRATRDQLEQRRTELSKKIKELMNSDSADAKCEIDKFKLIAQKVKRELKVVTSSLWDLESKVMPKLLSLPNDLHARTPDKIEKVLHTYIDHPIEKQHLNHVDIGNRLGLLKCIGPLCYYLINDAVKFELGSIQFFVDEFRKKEFIQFSNPDFVKSVVIEGVGMNHEDPMMSFILKRDPADDLDSPNRLHLVGGSSVGPFCSYFAKQISQDHLPIKLFATGRQYNPQAIQTNGSLINSCQANTLQFFVALQNCPKTEDILFGELLADLISCYENFGYHFRVVYLPAERINSWENLRASFQMYSSYSQSYVEVGSLSLCSDYISKRLLMYYQKSGKMLDFFRVITGTAISIPKVLACVLENPNNFCEGKLILPSNVEKIFPS